MTTTATTGTHHFADCMKGNGVTHVFLLPAILSPALARMEEIGITPVACHSEVAAAYIADGYARAGLEKPICK